MQTFVRGGTLLCSLLFLQTDSFCGRGDSTTTPHEKDLAIRVYLDCDGCDQDHIKSKLTFVNYVRDRHDSQVHIMITSERTGSGGRQYTQTFLGQREFSGVNDTLTFGTRETDSDDTIRNEMIRVMKLGLVRYAGHTPPGKNIVISYQDSGIQNHVSDPWNYWVFRTRLHTYFNGEKSRNYLSLSGSVSASRTTNDLKFGLSVYGNYNENNFDIDGSTISSFSRSKGLDASAVLSLDDHWSWGVSATLYSSTYQNMHLSTGPDAALEFNVYPYVESTRRQLRIAYELSHRYIQYEEETIYDKTNEHLLKGELSATLELKERWGSVEARLESSHYFHDFSKNRLELFTELTLSLVEGLSLEVFGRAALLHDQLSLPKEDASAEEILLQRTELATQFEYYGSVGLSYAFGSIYSNIVNPRFGTF